MAVRNIFIANNLALVQGVNSNIKALAVSSQLMLTDEVIKNLSSKIVADMLYVSQLVGVSKTLHLQAANVLTLTQETFPRVTLLSILQYLLVWQTLRKELPLLRNSLSIGQVVAVDKVKPTSNALALVQSVSLSKTSGQHIAHTIVFDQDVTAYKPSEYFIQGG